LIASLFCSQRLHDEGLQNLLLLTENKCKRRSGSKYYYHYFYWSGFSVLKYMFLNYWYLKLKWELWKQKNTAVKVFNKPNSWIFFIRYREEWNTPNSLRCQLFLIIFSWKLLFTPFKVKYNLHVLFFQKYFMYEYCKIKVFLPIELGRFVSWNKYFWQNLNICFLNSKIGLHYWWILVFALIFFKY